MSRQVDVASGGLCERKEFSRRILPLRSVKRLLERASSIYYGLGYAVLLGIVHRVLPWRPAKQALDSTVTFLNTTDCRTRRRARQPRPAQIPTSWVLCWCIARRSGGIPAIVRGRLPRSRVLENFADFQLQSTNAIPSQLSHSFRLGRDSRRIRLLRFLVGYRHFSAHAKAILRQMTI